MAFISKRSLFLNRQNQQSSRLMINLSLFAWSAVILQYKGFFYFKFLSPVIPKYEENFFGKGKLFKEGSIRNLVDSDLVISVITFWMHYILFLILEIKLFAIANWIFHASYVFRSFKTSFETSFKYSLILLRYSSTDTYLTALPQYKYYSKYYLFLLIYYKYFSLFHAQKGFYYLKLSYF